MTYIRQCICVLRNKFFLALLHGYVRDLLTIQLQRQTIFFREIYKDSLDLTK